MNQNEAEKGPADFNRRDFIKGASFGTLMMMMGGVPLQAEDKPAAAGDKDTNYNTVGAPVSCAVIGCGYWGREILQTLAVLPNAPVVAISDTYAPFLHRAKEAAPKAETYEDYRQALANKAVQAVIVATPSHQHREIVLAALQAGKHVYCEAPLGSSVEDARAIAQAAKAAAKVNFQAGLQARSDPQLHFLRQFIRSGALGTNVMARSQWHKKESWRHTSPKPEREKEINWRLNQETSPGLMGEVGVHQLDLISWFLNERPVAVSGLGGILGWNDGRDVADTIQSVFEFPEKVNYTYDCTLANSFDADYDMIYGSYAAVMIRGNKAWMFKESDSPLLGWEVYARKDTFYQETGIALVANATKLVALQEKPKTDADHYKESPLHFALAAFIKNCDLTGTAVANFKATYGDDEEGLADLIAGLHKSRTSSAGTAAAGYKEGFEATMAALKANEAIVQGQKVLFKKEWFDI
ncbi:MAG TPA: Gfo/Idh/MocA family oxidoreductase [Verrucomicrobiae bacterium]|nr:Gfo/Idh/MocA family oxidoreductase [Verrucomicrobiae bacterium]